MKRALVIVDVQKDYFDDGCLPLVGMAETASNVQKLLSSFRAAQWSIFHIQHMSIQDGATFFVPGTAGCEIHPDVAPGEGESVIVKNFPSAFRNTGLDEQLREEGIEALVICGAMSHMCIDTTTRAAFDLGYQCTVISDACSTRNLEFEGRVVDATDVQAAYMAALQAPFARVLKAEAYLESG